MAFLRTTLTPLGQINQEQVEGVVAGFVAGSQSGNGGATSLLPVGWAYVLNGLGYFQITHNLGHENYAVTVSTDHFGECKITHCWKTPNYFEVKIEGAGDAPINADFTFILKEIEN